MELSRNTNLITSVCSTEIRSITANPLLASFTSLYGTTSRISFTCPSAINNGGVYYRPKLSLRYPGLKEDDFNQFHQLLHEGFDIRVHYTNGDIYQLTTDNQPLYLKTNYDHIRGFSLDFQGETLQPPRKVDTDFTVPDPQQNYLLFEDGQIALFEDGQPILNE